MPLYAAKMPYYVPITQATAGRELYSVLCELCSLSPTDRGDRPV